MSNITGAVVTSVHLVSILEKQSQFHLNTESLTLHLTNDLQNMTHFDPQETVMLDDINQFCPRSKFLDACV